MTTVSVKTNTAIHLADSVPMFTERLLGGCWKQQEGGYCK